MAKLDKQMNVDTRVVEPIAIPLQLTSGTKQFDIDGNKIKTPDIPTGYKFVGMVIFKGALVKV